MRLGAWGVTLAGVLASAPMAHADIYRYRDASGVLVFTNAPAAQATRLVVKERPLPPAPRLMVASRGFRDILS